MSYYLADVKAAREKIAAACPDILFETLDYGFRLIGYKDKWWERPGETPKIIMQPARSENGIADVDALIAEWSK